MQFIFSTPVLIRHLWQLETSVFLHRCPIRTVPFGNIIGLGGNQPNPKSHPTIPPPGVNFMNILLA